MTDPLNFRNEYGKSKIDESALPENPMEFFERWLQDAFDADLPEPSAVTLATSNVKGRVSSRIILLKSYEAKGFQFYTNYKSQKGKDLNENPYAAMSFFWPELERQILIEGKVKKMSKKDSELYHSARPRSNQLGAWASEQSKAIKDRYTLEARYEVVSSAYLKHEAIPKPPHWGGYVLIPDSIEFWQGRENRLHDRIEYFLSEEDSWQTRRLNP